MKIEARLDRPDDVDVTLTITMPLAVWKKLRDILLTNPFDGSYYIRKAIFSTTERLESRVRGDLAQEQGENR